MRVKNLLLFVAIFTMCATQIMAASEGKSVHTSKCKIRKNSVVFETPKREKGQESMLGFAAKPIKTVRIGVIGLGMRGPGAVQRFTNMDGVEIKALCDMYPERVTKTQELLVKANFPKAAEYSGESGWKVLCERDDIDLVYIATDWRSHTQMAVYAMEQGKHVAIEVPAAQSVDECWQLVNTSERTRKHCMMLENCVYDFFELTTLNMAQKGLFGEILHTEGSYIHDLSGFWNAYRDDWRMDFNRYHNGDVYSTHGLGPACQLLNIHRGDKMNYLVAVDTKSVNGPAFLKTKRGQDVVDFKNGDHTLTLIKTEKGKTIHLQHNVYTPRPYSRMYQLTGTDGFANKYPISGYSFNPKQLASTEVPNLENLSAHDFVPDEVKKELMAKYKHPIHIKMEEKAKKVGGHGGMDFIMDSRLIYCLQNGLPLDQDVYDAAEWSCIGELTAKSIEHGSMPIAVPDFTRGEWNRLKGLTFAE